MLLLLQFYIHVPLHFTTCFTYIVLTVSCYTLCCRGSRMEASLPTFLKVPVCVASTLLHHITLGWIRFVSALLSSVMSYCLILYWNSIWPFRGSVWDENTGPEQSFSLKQLKKRQASRHTGHMLPESDPKTSKWWEYNEHLVQNDDNFL